jgi:ABC-type Fe3+ transport system substrate-binding protein
VPATATRTVATVARAAAMWVAAAFLAVGAACTKDGATVEPTPAPAPRKLTIITPHSAEIREAFEMGFSDWCLAHRGTFAQIDWIPRGTPRSVDYISRVFSGLDDGGARLTPDLMFGGGIADHMLLAERGHSMKLDLGDALERIPAEVNGLPTRDPAGRWFATGLSSFGIVYNRRACRERGIEPPATWADLADPRFQGWLGVADPTASGSHHQAMIFILQSQGWERGWSTLIRVLANTRALVDSSSAVLDQIGAGVFLAGFAVNFDGLARVDRSAGELAYVNPPGATAVTPDVTSVLKSAADVQLAEDFIRFCLSDAGQATWSVKAEFRASGGATLYHYPIDPGLYATRANELSVTENPFETDFGMALDLELASKRGAALIPLVRAVCEENHILLQRAWGAVLAAAERPAALAELCAPLSDEPTALRMAAEHQHATPARAREIEAEWSALFREKCEKAISLAGG